MPGLSVVVTRDYDDLSRTAADAVSDLVASRPRATVLAATGETPMGLYAELARRAASGTLRASELRVVQLDEYLGVEPEDRRSLYGWIVRSFTSPLGIPEGSVVRLATDVDPATACADYDAAVERLGGLDLAILGVGANGHLGFNEPPSDATAATREVELSPESVRSSAGYWGGREHVPPRAITAGMAQILAARRILLLASGAGKRDILHRVLDGPVTADVPASFLQRAGNVTTIVDAAAWGDGERP